jgi:hypothetical protein
MPKMLMNTAYPGLSPLTMEQHKKYISRKKSLTVGAVKILAMVRKGVTFTTVCWNPWEVRGKTAQHRPHAIPTHSTVPSL